jgi:hypothetical protein
MKIYVENYNNIPYTVAEFNIEVFYDVDFDLSIYADENSEIRPVKLPIGERDMQAIADYDSFTINIYGIIGEFFEEVEMDYSDQSHTFRYFYTYAKSREGTFAAKFMIRLRLSNHEYLERHNAELEKDAQGYKYPKEKKLQKWKLKQITINGKRYQDYYDAEDAIEQESEEFRKKMLDKR